MKKVLVIVMVLVPIICNADISQSAGICAAYQYVKGDMTKAQLAINHAENTGKMQVASRQWIEDAKTNPEEAVKRALSACIMDLSIFESK